MENIVYNGRLPNTLRHFDTGAKDTDKGYPCDLTIHIGRTQTGDFNLSLNISRARWSSSHTMRLPPNAETDKLIIALMTNEVRVSEPRVKIVSKLLSAAISYDHGMQSLTPHTETDQPYRDFVLVGLSGHYRLRL